REVAATGTPRRVIGGDGLFGEFLSGWNLSGSYRITHVSYGKFKSKRPTPNVEVRGSQVTRNSEPELPFGFLGFMVSRFINQTLNLNKCLPHGAKNASS